MSLYFDSWNHHNCWGLADHNIRNEDQMNKFLKNFENTFFPELVKIGINPKELYQGDVFYRPQAFELIDILQSNALLGKYP